MYVEYGRRMGVIAEADSIAMINRYFTSLADNLEVRNNDDMSIYIIILKKYKKIIKVFSCEHTNSPIYQIHNKLARI
jgi:hypothetical protein